MVLRESFMMDNRRTRRAKNQDITITSRLDNGVFLVNGHRGIEYRVNLTEQSCTCPDWQKRELQGGCKHIRAVVFAVDSGQHPDTGEDQSHQPLESASHAWEMHGTDSTNKTNSSVSETTTPDSSDTPPEDNEQSSTTDSTAVNPESEPSAADDHSENSTDTQDEESDSIGLLERYGWNHCPLCSGTLVSLTRIIRRKAVCEDCGAVFRYEWKKLRLIARYTLENGDPELEGETRKISEWQRMAKK